MDSTPGRASRPRRLLLAWVGGLSVLATAMTLLLLFMGLADGRSVLWLGVGLVLGLVALGSWKIVERLGPRGAVLAWIAFPVAWISVWGQLPFFALAVYSPLEETFSQEGRVEARVVERPEGRRLELIFPKPVEAADDSNLRLDDRPLPRAYYQTHREQFRWIGSRRLSIDLEAVLRDLEIEAPSTVVVNGDLTSRPFHYRDGERVPSQTVEVEPE